MLEDTIGGIGGVLSGKEAVKVDHSFSIPPATLAAIAISILLTAVFTGLLKKAI